MSRETFTTLNQNQLIGFTEKRGNAWHYREEYQGAESNHYPHAIPAEDVRRRLFSWAAESRPLRVSLPSTLDEMLTANHGGSTDGATYEISDDGTYVKWVPVKGRQAITRSDTGALMGIFSDGYKPHQYNEWLVQVMSTIVGDTLSIGSAGLLRGGALAYVQIEVPENIDTPQGVSFRPNLLAGTSFDGSVATFYKRTATVVVCDNTFEMARSETSEIYKIKHSRYSGFNAKNARDALGIVTGMADDFAAEVAALCETTVTDKQFSAFLDALVPMTDEKGQKVEGAAATKRGNKQDALTRLWIRDPRVSPWKNTAFGVVQAVNTYTHHLQTVKGATRPERNMVNVITGATAKEDNRALDLLGKILSNA
jgi:phage/plasmid-like protein (TIGR03299 family)